MRCSSIVEISCFFLIIANSTPTRAQVCTPGPHGWAPTGQNTNDPRNCVNLYACYSPQLEPVEYVTVGGCDPTTGPCTVRAQVRATFRGNHLNQTASPPYPGSPIWLNWTSSGGGTIGSCGLSGAAIWDDEGDAFLTAGNFSCDNPQATTGTGNFNLRVRVCQGATGCAQSDVTVPIPLTPDALTTALCPPPPPQTACADDCGGCIGGGGPGVSPASGGGGRGGGSSPGGGGSGPGALLQHATGSVGSPGRPTPTDWPLGRNWSHSYARSIIPSPSDPDRVYLLTEAAVYQTFDDTNSDGTYDQVSPADVYETLEQTAGGWTLTHLDGSEETFDTNGRWQGMTDRNGNAITTTYTGSQLTQVSFPDGRHEDFTYHPDGKLATITEVGVDGSTSLAWAYTWTGDDLTRIDRPDGTALVHTYDDPANPGYLTRTTLEGTDGTSERVLQAWEYDAQGNTTKMWRGATLFSDGVDRWELSYDDPVLPTETTVTDPLGNVATYTWAADRTARTQKAKLAALEGDCPVCGLGPTSQLFYDDPLNPFRVTREIDGLGIETHFSYDTQGRRTLRAEAVGTALERETSWTWDPTYPALVATMEQPSVEGFPELKLTTHSYDASGNRDSLTVEGFERGAAFSLTTTYTHNAAGNVLTVDPPGHAANDVVSFSYDATRGNGLLVLASRTDPIIGTTSYGHDAFNRRTMVTDPNGVLTETEYDPLDRVTRITQRGATMAEDLVTEHRYNVFGDLFQTVFPEGNVIEYAYDSAGRLTSIERKADDQASTHGERVLFTLDGIGNRIREQHQQWDGATWQDRSESSYAYSSRCHIDSVTRGATGEESTTEFAYDCDGRLERTWDANHPSMGQTEPATTEYLYDELDRLTEVRQPFGTTGTAVSTFYGYDVQDHLVSVTDGEGAVTTYDFSDRNLLTQEVSEVSGTTESFYDEHGELTQRIDARGITETRTLDALDRLTLVDYADDSLDITLTYDDPGVPFSLGRLTRIERGGTVIDMGYDRFGRVTQDGELLYHYDGNGNRTRVEYPGGMAAVFTHDYADRPQTLTLERPAAPDLPVVTAATYEPSGPLATLSLGNGLAETRAHDSRYYPDAITVDDGAATTVLDWDYSTDAEGNPTAIADLLNAANNRSYAYQDVQYFLTQGNGPWGSLSWTYDMIGNRLTETRDGQTDTYSYAPNLAGGNSAKLETISLAGGGSRTYGYDAAGNQDQVSEGADVVLRSYDEAGRLSFQERNTNQSSATFSYDGRSFLAQATGREPDGSGNGIFCDGFESGDTAAWGAAPTVPGTCFATLETHAVYSSEGTLHSRTSAGDTVHIIYFGGRPVAQFALATGETTYLITDHLGTPVLATDEGGAVTWAGGFEPFGSDYAGASAAGVFLRFPGQWVDAGWGSISAFQTYNLFRWYEASLGQYTRRDPIRFRGLHTRYGYADYNPARKMDFPGLQPPPLPIPPVLGRDPFRMPIDPEFRSGPWGQRPDEGCCSKDEILDSLQNADTQIFRLDAGIPLEGTVASFVITEIQCVTGGWCIPSPIGVFDPPMNPRINDPCVRFCIRAHEWFHFQDQRPWNFNWDGSVIMRFQERPGYEIEALCLLTFL